MSPDTFAGLVIWAIVVVVIVAALVTALALGGLIADALTLPVLS